MVNITVNDKKIEVSEKQSLLNSLRQKGFHIPGMCLNPELIPFGSCRLCQVDINGKTTTACSLVPTEGMNVRTINEDLFTNRKYSLELLASHHTGDCIGPCQQGCPTHCDIQGYLALIAEGKHHEAVKLMKEKYILPAVLGRVCPAFCESDCRRNLVEGAVAIRQLKRFAADVDLEAPWMPDIPPPTGKAVAVVGGGPAGLSCGYYLRRKGHAVTIFEAQPELGGWTRYGIPTYRLPKDILRKDIATVINTGITVKTGCALGKDVTLDQLKKDFDAVFMGVGAWSSRMMNIEGEDLKGVIHGIEFLKEINMGKEVPVGKKVVAVGGGNTAMDVVRVCRRMGVDVTLTYRRSHQEMPAAQIEVEEAQEEGVKFELMTNPIRIYGNGKVEKVELLRMELGEPDESGRRSPLPVEGSNFFVDADTVILAIGQYNTDEILKGYGLKSSRGMIGVHKTTLQTEIDGVFAGGDAVLGPSTVIESIYQGRVGALMIDLYLKEKLEAAQKACEESGQEVVCLIEDPDIREVVNDLNPYNHVKQVTEEDYKDVEHHPRSTAETRGPEERIRDWEEFEENLKPEDVAKEAQRCMSCGCMDIFECTLRSYATIYGARQDRFSEKRSNFDIDDSHPNIILDNNKCILCGQCVNHTQEIAGEDILAFAHRGFVTKISPAPRTTLGQAKAKLLGDIIDVCPTGALTEKLPFEKPGPWKATPIPTICNGCGVGCEINIEVYEGLLVRASRKPNSWNRGHLCDIGRFDRPWDITAATTVVKEGDSFKTIDFEKAVAMVKEHMTDMAIILGPDVTQEEARMFADFAEKHNMKIGSTARGSVSTAGYQAFLKAGRIRLDIDTDHYPVLKIFIREARRQGAELVKGDCDLAIVEAPQSPNGVPTLVMHKGINDVGLIKLGITGVPKAGAYLFVGNLTEKLDGYTVVLGSSEHADLVLPYPCWPEKKGTVFNSAGMELEVNRIRAPAVDAAEILSSLIS